MIKKLNIYIILSLVATSMLSCQFSAPKNKANYPQKDNISNEVSQISTDSTIWAKWFQENREFYMYTAVLIEPGCENEQHHAVNDLLSLLYKGNDLDKENWEMIQWRLNQFYRINSEPNDSKQEYSNILIQIDSLLNFPVEIDSHERRKKSDLTLFMKHFLINTYYTKLLEKYEDLETKNLIVAEQIAWNEYYKSTADAFYKIILGEDSYYLKPVFWNNYKIAIADQRIKAILSMYFDDISIWNFNDMCRWDFVAYEYDQIRKYIRNDTTPGYSTASKLKAIDADGDAFGRYLNARFSLAHKTQIYDENCVIHDKSIVLENYINAYNN